MRKGGSHMYHVLLVDDEASVVESLQQAIKWKEYELEVAAVASNGRDALKFIDEQDIDVVITDIRMATISGLELCQQISRKYPEVQTIIMSGYAEFSYAQRAMTYGVIGYCLKPIEYDEMTKHLVHAVQRLKERNSPPDRDTLLDALQSSDTAVLSEALCNFGFCEKQFYTAVSVGVGQITIPEQQGICLPLGRKHFVYIMNSPIAEDIQKDALMQNYILGFSQTADPVEISRLSSVVNSLSASAYQFFVTPGCKKVEPGLEDSSASMLAKIYCAAAAGDRKETEKLLDAILASNAQGFTIHSALRLYNMVISGKLMGPNTESELYSPEQLISRFGCFSNMIAELHRKLRQAADPIAASSITNSGILQIIAYIDSHYEKELSLEQVSNQFHISPNYLCQVFHKETGKSFVKYITELRVQKACELLDATHYSISEIASSVGYDDYFYFLKTFKKIAGCTPKQYRTRKLYTIIDQEL